MKIKTQSGIWIDDDKVSFYEMDESGCEVVAVTIKTPPAPIVPIMPLRPRAGNRMMNLARIPVRDVVTVWRAPSHATPAAAEAGCIGMLREIENSRYLGHLSLDVNSIHSHQAGI